MINNDVEGDIINVYLEVDADKEMNLEKNEPFHLKDVMKVMLYVEMNQMTTYL